MSEHPFVEVLTKIQYDLTSLQARVTDLKRNLVAELPPERPAHVCEPCGGLAFRSATKLAEHTYVSHGGPEPAHWLAAAALSDEAA